MLTINVTSNSKNFTILRPSGLLLSALEGFIESKLRLYDLRDWLKRPRGDKHNADIKYEFVLRLPEGHRFPIHTLHILKPYLRNTIGDVEWVVESTVDYEPEYVHQIIRKDRSPWKTQKPSLDFISTNHGIYNSSLLKARPGFGKTCITYFYAGILNQRFMGVFPSEYMDVWSTSIAEFMVVEEGDMLLVRGTVALNRLFKAVLRKDKLPKFIIISNGTYLAWTKKWLKTKEVATMGVKRKKWEYPCDPTTLCEFFSIGVLYMDEAHATLYRMWLVHALSNVPRLLGLSGSYVSNDKVVKNIHDILYPSKYQFTPKKTDNYTVYVNMLYKWNSIHGTPDITESGSTMYSHIAYEKWIMKDKDRLASYINLMENMCSVFWDKRKDDNQRLLVFCASKKLCTLMHERLSDEYPSLEFTLYIEDEEYDNLIKADGSVASPQKASAAVDIPSLITVVNSVNYTSPQKLIQIVGRLRPIKDVKVIFVQLNCADIPKHTRYEADRVEIYKSMTFTQMVKQYKYSL